MSWRSPSTGWRLGSTPSSISSQGSSASHNVECGGWRVDGGEFVVWLDLEIMVLEPPLDETGLLVGDLKGRGRKSSFAMQAEVIWRLDEFDEQDGEEEKDE